jgi:hypothetical protein
MSTVPTMQRTVDDQFVQTWYEIREQAVDNILDATVFWLALREHGCLVPQTGGEYITRTVHYGTKQGQNISKGATLKQSIAKRETMAWWDWAYSAIDINRTLIDDQKNAGPSKIKDYVQNRIMHAREDIVQKMEDDIFGWGGAIADQMQGIFDIVQVADTDTDTTNWYGLPTFNFGTPIKWAPQNLGQTVAASGVVTGAAATSFGNISRADNTWWRNPAPKAGANPEINLRSDMNTFFNTISDNIAPPNFIICDQDLYEYYEEEAVDKIQVVRTSFNAAAADLGFETLTFKGKPMTWSGKLANTDKMFFLNLDYIELVYDPNYWFDMTEWFTTPSQLERVAYIISAQQLIDSQPRRHGMIDYNAYTNVL